MYPLNYQYNMDIDWFYIDGRYPIHAASNGGYIAKWLFRISDLQSVQATVMKMQPRFDYVLNSKEIIANMSNFYVDEVVADLVEHRREVLPEGFELSGQVERHLPQWMPFYTWSFIEMARRGFYSFDKKESNDEYYLVAAPIKRLTAAQKEGLNRIPTFIRECILTDYFICDVNDIYNEIKNILRLIPFRENGSNSNFSNEIAIRFKDMILSFWIKKCDSLVQ